MNKLSVFHEHIFEAADQRGISVEKALEYAKSCGIDLLECDLWRLDDRRNVKALFDSCGMGVSSIYSHFDFLHDTAQHSAEKYQRLFDTAAFFCAEKVLCIPGFFDSSADRNEQMKRFADGLSQMCTAAQEYNITVTIEDFDDILSPCCKTADIKWLLDRCEGLKYTFDTGNFRYCLEDADEAYSLLKNKVAHVHCKDRSYDVSRRNSEDTNGKADLSGAVMYPAEVCGGMIGINALISRLLHDGYDGIFAIEHFGAADQLEYMKRSADNLRSCMEVKA